MRALNSAELYRLKKSWARLDRKTAKQWEYIQELTKSGGKKLAPIVKKAPPPCVPYVGLHLGSLITFAEFPTVIKHEEDGENALDLINFQVLRQIGDVVSEILRHQQMPFIFEVDEQLAAAFMYPQQFNTEDERFNRSLLVEPREPRQ